MLKYIPLKLRTNKYTFVCIFDGKIFSLDFLALCMEVYGVFFWVDPKSKMAMATSWEHMTLWQIRTHILHINY
jgi:hypothetical protein